MKHVLAIDAGTTGVTCLVLGDDGRIAGRGYREVPQYFPEPGWVEHDASEILECSPLLVQLTKERRFARAAINSFRTVSLT